MDRTLARRLIFGSAAIGSLGTFAMHAILPIDVMGLSPSSYGL